jgi:hypothetical protein
MNPLIDVQLRFNATSRDGWDVFAGHRKIVTELLTSAAPTGTGRLCVLGAGNCNDLDLGALRAVYRDIHLVDLDAGALALGMERQGRAAGTIAHAGVDVTGMMDVLAGWSPQTAVSDADLVACRERPVQQVGPTLSGPFDVAASTCLLSQLIFSVTRSAGERHPRFVETIQAVRLGHLRLLTDLVAPGGTGVLVTDVVSSDSFPPLGSVPEDRLTGVLAELIRRQNFFHGVNPAVLLAAFRTDPGLSAQVEAVEPRPPWLWNLGPRVYAAWALTFRKRGQIG